MRIIVDRGRQPGSSLAYLFREDKRQKGREADNPIFHTNMFGRTPSELAEELRFSADLNPRVERTFVQYKLSFPPGENPDPLTKVAIVEDLLHLRQHGSNCQFFALEHFDKIQKHDVHHLHVLASTVRLDGSWVDDAFERVRLKPIERVIEAKYGLIDSTPQSKGQRMNTSIRELKLRELRLKEKRKPLLKDSLRAAIDLALHDQPAMPLLMARLKAQGFSMHFHQFEDGRGVSFGAEGLCCQGRQLGDRFSFSGLQLFGGVDYQPERDDLLLQQLNQMSKLQAQDLCGRLEAQKSRKLLGEELMQQLVLVWQGLQGEQAQIFTAAFDEFLILSDEQGRLDLFRSEVRLVESGSLLEEFQPTDLLGLKRWLALLGQSQTEVHLSDVEFEPILGQGGLEPEVQAQGEAVQGLALLIQQVWQQQKLADPAIDSVDFDDFHIRLSHQDQLLLYRGESLLLGGSEGHTLSLLDCNAIASTFQTQYQNLLLNQQHLEHQKYQQQQQKLEHQKLLRDRQVLHHPPLLSGKVPKHNLER